MKKNILLTFSIGLLVGILTGACVPLVISQMATVPELVLPSPAIHRTAYSLSYDSQHRNPNWVYEYLTSNSCSGTQDRSKFEFQADPLLPDHLQANNVDFRGSGFDRGHLCPAGDWKNESMAETFYLSNVSPQLPEFNRGYWLGLEKHVRNLTNQYSGLHIFTGPLYLPHQESDGKFYVKYQVIGEDFVAVPTHFFKVIFMEKEIGITSEAAYILPNEAIDEQTPLEKFKTTVEKVEKLAGFIFRKDLRSPIRTP